MGTNTIDKTNIGDGKPFRQSSVNQYADALDGDVVGRQNGLPVAGENLGNTRYPWGNIHANNLLIDNQPIDFSTLSQDRYKIVSGQVNDNGLPDFLIPNNDTQGSFTIAGAVTPLFLLIDGQEISINKNIRFDIPSKRTGTMPKAPARNNDPKFRTFVPVDEDLFMDNELDRLFGRSIEPKPPTPWVIEVGEYFTVGLATLQSDQVGGSTITIHEVVPCFGYVSNNGFKIIQKYRYFRFAGQNQYRFLVPASIVSSQFLWTYWVFIDADNIETPVISGRSPLYDRAQPEKERITENRLWFNQQSQKWNSFDSNGENPVERRLIPVGIYVSNPTGTGQNISGATRSFWFDKDYKKENTMTIKGRPYQVKSLQSDGPCSVGVEDKVFHYENITWDIESTVSTGDIPANTVAYFYIREDGSQIIDFPRIRITDSTRVAMSTSPDRDVSLLFNGFTLPPVYVGKKKGYYHRWFPWRCVGSAYVVENASNEKVFDYSLFTTVKYSTVEKFPYYYNIKVPLNPDTSTRIGTLEDPHGVATSSSSLANGRFKLFLSPGALKYNFPDLSCYANIARLYSTIGSLVIENEATGQRSVIVTAFRSTLQDIEVQRVDQFNVKTDFTFQSRGEEDLTTSDSVVIGVFIFLNGFDYELRRLWNILS